MNPEETNTPPINTDAPSTTSPVTPPPAEETLTEAEKIERARLAMEGPEHAAKREAEEHQKTLQIEKEEIEKKLTEILKEKEQLELAWVELDDKRGGMKKILQPILDEEDQIEKEEAATEEEEKKMGLEREKKVIEQKKWLIEDKRRKVEQEKWNLEEKVWKLEEAIETNTKRYRELLDQEEELNTRLEKIKKEIL